MFKPHYIRIFKLLASSVFIGMIVIQFIPSSFQRTNPPVTGEPPWSSPGTRATFMTACGDCHSNETVYPWYSGIAPVSWLVEKDVREGRRHFNISEWDNSTRGGDDAAEEVQKGSMPVGPYLLMHPDANLNAAQKKIFVDGLMKTFGSDHTSSGNKEKKEHE